jgi:hypothetical protein
MTSYPTEYQHQLRSATSRMSKLAGRSETVLVHAAHRIFRRHPSSGSSSVRGVQLKVLNKLVKQGLVEESPRGGLAARFLLLHALSENGLLKA